MQRYVGGRLVPSTEVYRPIIAVRKQRPLPIHYQAARSSLTCLRRGTRLRPAPRMLRHERAAGNERGQ